MNSATFLALSALALPAAPAGSVPDWVHLMPKGPFAAYDGRGPWRYEDAAAVILESFAARPRIHIDLNHSTDTAAKMGFDAPAVGYVLEMEERDNGIWGRIDWTERGRAALSDREYWGISPVIRFDEKTKVVRAIARAALTNDPAVATLTPLSAKEQNAMFTAKVAKMLGLADDASEEDILSAMGAKMTDKAEAPLTALSAVGAALGLEGAVTETQLVAAVRGLKASGGEQNAQYAALQARVTEMETAEKRRSAEAFVDQAIRDRRSGVKAERDSYVALHMENPAMAAKLINAQPMLAETHTGQSRTEARPAGEGIAALSAEERAVAVALNLDPATYLAQLKADAAQKDAR
jgi:phage I-like protein